MGLMTTKNIVKKGLARIPIHMSQMIKNPLGKIFHIDPNQEETAERNICRLLASKQVAKKAEMSAIIMNRLPTTDRQKCPNESKHLDTRNIHFCQREDTRMKSIKQKINNIRYRPTSKINMEPMIDQPFSMKI